MYAASDSDCVLEVNDLRVSYGTGRSPLLAVDGVSLKLLRASRLALVGESGSGKTQLALAIMGLLPSAASVAGSVRLRGEELLGLGFDRLQDIRGRRVAIVFQDPMSSLTPHVTIGTQLREVIQRHGPESRGVATEKALAALQEVRVPWPERRMRQYPHELSGGTLQRVAIAMALLGKPELLIADEPTTALDAGLRGAILSLLRELQQRTGMALLLISHDLEAVAQTADSIAVMYAGRIVEMGDAQEVRQAPHHPYTRGLLQSAPSFDRAPRTPLPSIPGELDRAVIERAGCSFAPRCGWVHERCLQEPPGLRLVSNRVRMACHGAGAA